MRVVVVSRVTTSGPQRPPFNPARRESIMDRAGYDVRAVVAAPERDDADGLCW